MQQLNFLSHSSDDAFNKYGDYRDEIKLVGTAIPGKISPQQQRVPGGKENMGRKMRPLCESFIISHGCYLC